MLIGNRSVKVGFKRREEARKVLAAVSKVKQLGAVCRLLISEAWLLGVGCQISRECFSFIKAFLMLKRFLCFKLSPSVPN